MHDQALCPMVGDCVARTVCLPTDYCRREHVAAVGQRTEGARQAPLPAGVTYDATGLPARVRGEG